MQGANPDLAASLAVGDLEQAAVSPREEALLRFAERLTKSPSQTRKDHIEQLRQAGWSDEQIAEAVYVIAMFAFFNRVADAFGLADPGYDRLAQDKPVEPATKFQPNE